MAVFLGGGGVDTSEVNAAAGDVRSGKKIVDADGNVITGNKPTKSASDVTASGATVTVPAGIYDSQVQKSVAGMTLPSAADASAAAGSSQQAEIAASTSDRYINIPTGYNGAKKHYKLKGVVTQTKTATANGTVSADSGKFLTSVTVAIPTFSW